jgi:hypothetical protein
VPVRDPDSPVAERFQAGKSVEALSAAEKIVRNVTASQDPFATRTRVGQGLSAYSVAGDPAPGRLNSGGKYIQFADWTRSSANICEVGSVLGAPITNVGDGRQVSQGAIWAVGGLAPGPTTTDDGRIRRVP